MKKLLLIFFGLCNIFGSCQYKNVEKIELRKTSFYALRIFAVSCDDYSKNTKGEEVLEGRTTITDRDTIKKLCELIYNLERDTNSHGVMEAYAKLWIYYKDRVDIICTDGAFVLIKGDVYIMTDELKHYIEDIPPNTRWIDRE